MIEIIGSLLEQHAYQAPEPACTIFPQYYAEEERGCLSMEAHSAVLEDNPFYQTTDDEARPDVSYDKMRGEGVAGRMQRQAEEAHPYDHQEDGEQQSHAHKTYCLDVGSGGVVQPTLQHPEYTGIVPDGYEIQPPIEGEM